jgi:hypothetical protein
MDNKFDELAKGLALTTTRRQALKKFGVGLAGMALACFGLANRAEAGRKCGHLNDPCAPFGCCHGLVCGPFTGICQQPR